MGKQVNPMFEANNNQDRDNADDDDKMGFHNPLFSSTVGVPKDRRCVCVDTKNSLSFVGWALDHLEALAECSLSQRTPPSSRLLQREQAEQDLFIVEIFLR